MAIYYIDPHTTVNGAGTWASPWSLGTNTRTGLATGDEIRVKGVALSSLLTATTYAASFTSAQSITITSGGGLGADFVAGSIIYFPQYDTFAKIVTSVGNVLSIYGTSMMPIYNSSAGAGTIEVREVDLATYSVSSTSSYYLGSGSVNNLTISDGWTDETTRVTDGTVKSLFNSSSTAQAQCYLDSSSTGTYGHSIDLQNTHVMCSNSTSTSTAVTTSIYGSNTTATICQIFGQYINGGLSFGSTTSPVYNTSVTLTHCGSVLIGSSYGKDITVTATNTATYCADAMLSSTAMSYVNNLTINLGYIISAVVSYNVGSLLYAPNAYNATINYNGMVDIYASGGISYLLSGYGHFTANFHPTNFSVKYNKRVSTQTSVTYGLYSNSSMTSGDVFFVPSFDAPTGWTITNTKYYMPATPIGQGNAARSPRIPNVTAVDFPTATSASIPYGASYNNNVLVTYRNGANPIEILSINGSGYNISTTSTSFPVVQRDASVYRTTAPSLKSYLGSRSQGYWTGVQGAVKTSMAAKPILIPVTSGVPVTISGYIRTDDAAYSDGDCDVSLMFLDVEVATQAMTTACINAWEQFTLTFTPSQTGEATLLWEMYYANGAKSYWLDDLVIT